MDLKEQLLALIGQDVTFTGSELVITGKLMLGKVKGQYWIKNPTSETFKGVSKKPTPTYITKRDVKEVVGNTIIIKC